MSEPIHPTLCLRLDCHLLRHTCVPRGPLTPRCGVLLHPEVLPSGIQVTAAFLAWRAGGVGEGVGGPWQWRFGTLARLIIIKVIAMLLKN